MNRHQCIYIALGSNQAHMGKTPARTLCFALGELVRRGVQIEAASRPWRTPAWPDPSDPPFSNACARVTTGLEPGALLDVLHEVEDVFGRARGKRNAPRTLDLDLIDYRGRVSGQGGDGLILPHPRAAARSFVLLPLREIAPDWRDPVSGLDIDRLVARLGAKDRARARPDGPPLVPLAVQHGA
ncbi:2-amino-4-hydroxy-6-hydroxymethyldihydropteridine diphosphokinase [Marinicauda pacifica]|uniref:2-amino-4-hydroxy-6- hydroxymethyldihydropteridine diphosphokinase n=1 Tax=Marinicauda pacifica TaxID=1133559 RepID=UPI0035C7C32E